MAVVTGKTSMSAPSAVLIARSINRLDTGSVNSNGSAVRIVPVGALKHSLVAPHFARRVAWKEASRGWEISRHLKAKHWKQTTVGKIIRMYEAETPRIENQSQQAWGRN